MQLNMALPTAGQGDDDSGKEIDFDVESEVLIKKETIYEIILHIFIKPLSLHSKELSITLLSDCYGLLLCYLGEFCIRLIQCP